MKLSKVDKILTKGMIFSLQSLNAIRLNELSKHNNFMVHKSINSLVMAILTLDLKVADLKSLELRKELGIGESYTLILDVLENRLNGTIPLNNKALPMEISTKRIMTSFHYVMSSLMHVNQDELDGYNQAFIVGAMNSLLYVSTKENLLSNDKSLICKTNDLFDACFKSGISPTNSSLVLESLNTHKDIIYAFKDMLTNNEEYTSVTLKDALKRCKTRSASH